MTEKPDGQVSFFDQDTWSGRTCLAHSAATKDATSRQSSKKRSASRSRKPPVLKCLKTDGLRGGGTETWTDDGAWLGAYSTLNTGESPNVAVESRLSQILEEQPHTKYSLTPKACRGILRRAERRGKDLPETLKAALLMQSESGGGCDGGGKGALVQEDKSGTLGTGNDQTIFCLQGNGIDRADTAGCNGKGWREDVSYTLNTIDRPAVCAGFKLGNSEQARSIGYHEERAPTLNAECGGNKPVILDMSHANDVIRECGDVVPTLQSRMGTGGNQVPLAYGVGNGQLNEAQCMATEKAQTLNTMHDAQAVMQNMAVRRLTPLECERLQGFPDHWTDLGEWTDSKGKRHKDADSQRYKAIGNSIALPPWKWVLKRLCAQYERDATMGSLFDGIGGFPLIWIQLNGWNSVKWASEIEPFCIAVTKRHFGDKETGERGDMWEYLTGGKV